MRIHTTNNIKKTVCALLIAALCLGLLSGCFSGTTSGGKDGKSSGSTGQASVLEKLRDKIDDDTLVLYVEYEGLEQDAENYSDPVMNGLSESERAGMIRSTLTAKHLSEAFAAGLAERRKSICVIGTHSNITEGYENSQPELCYDSGVFRLMPYSTFWMKTCSIRRGSVSVGEKSEFYAIYEFTYFDLTDGEIAQMKAQIDAEVNDVVSRIPANADIWTKAKLAHDELIARMDYDHDFGEHCHDLYGAFVLRKPVCESYALAYRLVLQKAGVKSTVVVNNWSENNNSVGHAWNHITDFLGYDTYVDVTWDDSGWTDEHGAPYIRYDFFGLTQEELTAIESHSLQDDMSRYANAESFNYYNRQGYTVSSYDTGAIAGIMRAQYGTGSNLMSVRFENRSAYNKALAAADSTGDILNIVESLGYRGYYWYLFNEDTCTFSVGLGKQPGA